MKKHLLNLSLMFAISASSFAACLDTKPTTEAALQKEIRKAKIELANHQEIQKIFEDIALSAKKRNAIAKLVATGSTLPITFMACGVMGYVAGSTLMRTHELVGAISSLGLFFGPLVANGTISAKALAQLALKNGFSEKETEALVTEIEINNTRGCSYQVAQEKADELREHILETDLDGSFKHAVIDHLTLGSLSKNATEKLYHIAAYKTLLSEQKLKELQKIKL